MRTRLRQQALGALAVLRHTSHQDKADALSAYITELEARSSVALERATQLIDRGWVAKSSRVGRTALHLAHSRAFYQVHIERNGDAEFRLKRLRRPIRILASDAETFARTVDAIGGGRPFRLANWRAWPIIRTWRE